MNAEEAAGGWSDSAPQAGQAEELDAGQQLNSEEAMVETVGDAVPHWRRPHPRIVTGPLTGQRP